ncbi:MAG: hypothetical protein WB798_08420 [Nocardioidaceae bacterium]
MTTELEKRLARELHEVADGVQVPPMPSLVPLDEPRPRAGRLWPPLVVAAAVVAIIGVVALTLNELGAREPQPAPSPPPSSTSSPAVTGASSPTASPDPTRAADIAVTAPRVPYILDQRLYVAGRQVPGTWWLVESHDGVWLAQQSDGSWWSGGPSVDARKIDAEVDQPPVLSSNGRYLAFIDLSSGRPRLTGLDTRSPGDGLGQAPIDLSSTEGGVPIAVRAVTDEGDVIVQGTRTSLMWRALHPDRQRIVDLNATAPDQVVLQGTSAGLVAVDGRDGATDATRDAPYLAAISPNGRITPVTTLPTYDDLDISPGGSRLVRSPAGTLGGEVTSVATLRTQPVGSTGEVVLFAPDGWGFATGTWTWEDDETLVSVLLPIDGRERAAPRLVRCSVTLGACRAFAGPGTDDARGGLSAE